MSLIKLQGNASGTGALTIAAPNTNTDRTLTLPDTTGTIVMNEGSGIFKIDSSGNVGVGTASPGRTLDVSGIIRSDGTSGAFALGGNSSTPAEGAAIHRPAADTLAFVTASSERMRIDSSGDIYVGIDSGDPFNDNARIRIQDVGSSFIQIKSDATGTLGLLFGDTTDDFTAGVLSDQTDGNNLYFYTDNTSKMEITSTGEVVMPNVYSDTVTGRDLFISSTGKLGYVSSTRASKTNIQDLSDVSWLYSLNPVSFQYRVQNKDDTYSDEIQPQPEYGLIAEDVELVNPDLVFYDETENGRELRGIQYSRLIAPLLKAIQEQQSLITDLTARLTALEAN